MNGIYAACSGLLLGDWMVGWGVLGANLGPWSSARSDSSEYDVASSTIFIADEKETGFISSVWKFLEGTAEAICFRQKNFILGMKSVITLEFSTMYRLKTFPIDLRWLRMGKNCFYSLIWFFYFTYGLYLPSDLFGTQQPMCHHKNLITLQIP